jgi:dolichol-phosphate mannosyltransferase
MTLISIIVPVYNEGKYINAHLQTILKNAEMENIKLELITIDDGSKDDTALAITQASQQDQRIKPVFFTRNFGKEAAILAGLLESSGDAIIVIDSDLQHPPELIPKMIHLWQQGFPVVEAIKAHRGKESFLEKLSAKAFYWLFYYFANINMSGQCDYKLLDRSVVNAYVSLPKKYRFFRGLVYWLNYPSAQLPFEVLQRPGEQSSRWSRIKLIQYAINNLTSFSSFPLKIVTWLGLITFTFGFCIGIRSLIQKWQGEALNGFTTVNLLIILSSGVLMMSLGIIGHYLARIYDEIKGRPAYIRLPPKKEESQ